MTLACTLFIRVVKARLALLFESVTCNCEIKFEIKVQIKVNCV